MEHVTEYGARQAELPCNICCRRASPQPAACSVAAHASQLATPSSYMSLASAKPLATPVDTPNAHNSVSLTDLSSASLRLALALARAQVRKRRQAFERPVSETLLCAFGLRCSERLCAGERHVRGRRVELRGVCDNGASGGLRRCASAADIAWKLCLTSAVLGHVLH
jgi:hypothetical protein